MYIISSPLFRNTLCFMLMSGWVSEWDWEKILRDRSCRQPKNNTRKSIRVYILFRIKCSKRRHDTETLQHDHTTDGTEIKEITNIKLWTNHFWHRNINNDSIDRPYMVMGYYSYNYLLTRQQHHTHKKHNASNIYRHKKNFKNTVNIPNAKNTIKIQF